jgi:hypothetical protein
LGNEADSGEQAAQTQTKTHSVFADHERAKGPSSAFRMAHSLPSSSQQGLGANCVHGRFIDRAMELTGPTLVLIILVGAKSIDNQSCIASPLERAKECDFAACLRGTKREVPFELQALD